MEDNDFAFKKQKLTCARATEDDRARERVTGQIKVKESTKAIAISKKVSARILQDYPDVYEWKTDRNNNKFLQCKYCFDVLDDAVKCTLSKIDRHVTCPAHKDAVAAWQSQEARKKVLFSALKPDRSKITLAGDESIFRGAIVSAFLSAGISLNKLAVLWPCLEHYCNAKLDDINNLKKVYLPRLRLARLNEIKTAMKADAQILIIHDGTNRHSEFYFVVVRWCKSALNLLELLVALKACRGAHKGHELALMLNSLELPMSEVLEDGSYSAGGLLAVTRDRASVNQRCANVMKLMWMNYMDFECIWHTFSKVGEKMPLTCLTTLRDDLMMSPKKFCLWEARWKVIEQECFSVTYALTKPRPLIQGCAFTILNDHKNLNWMQSNESSSKIVRWSMVLDEYTVTWRHVPGKVASRGEEDATVVDGISRAQRSCSKHL
jgi:hypothetical protein